MLTRRKILGALMALPALAALAPRKAQAAQHVVSIQAMRFKPASLTIKAGDTVVFENKDGAPHTATARDKSWDTGRLRRGNTSAITFDTVGEQSYFCAIHTNMKGKITVT